jgi:hypothetical protein
MSGGGGEVSEEDGWCDDGLLGMERRRDGMRGAAYIESFKSSYLETLHVRRPENR